MASSLSRIDGLLELIAQNPRGVTHNVLVTALGIPKSSLTMLIRELLALGFVEKREHSNAYVIGHRLLALAGQTMTNMSMAQMSLHFLEQVARETGETSYFFFRSKRNAICLSEASGSNFSGRGLVQVGEVFAQRTSAPGKAIMAFTAGVFTDEHSAVLLDELAEVRRGMLSVCADDCHLGIVGVAAPVFNLEGRPIGSVAVFIDGNSSTDEEIMNRLRTSVRQGAMDFSKRIGFTGRLIFSDKERMPD